MRASNRSLAEHYTWGDACDGWRLVDDPNLSVIEEEMPACTAERTHFHNRSHQAFFVLHGELSITCGDQTVALSSGDALHIPPKTVHKVRNESRANARFLVVSSPSTAEDRVNVDESNSE